MEFNLKQKRLPLPTLVQIQKKREQIKELENRRLTEADVSAMIKRRQSVVPKTLSTTERLATKSRLMTEHRMALGRRDFEDVKRIQKELDEFVAMWESSGDGNGSPHSANNSGTEGPGGNRGEQNRLEAISARNRAQNLENARRIEAAEAEKRRLARVEAVRRVREKDRVEKEAAEKVEEGLDPQLEGADIGTRMAHLVEIDIDF
jgi:RNA polymerase-associated protein RTF1